MIFYCSMASILCLNLVLPRIHLFDSMLRFLYQLQIKVKFCWNWKLQVWIQLIGKFRKACCVLFYLEGFRLYQVNLITCRGTSFDWHSKSMFPFIILLQSKCSCLFCYLNVIIIHCLLLFCIWTFLPCYWLIYSLCYLIMSLYLWRSLTQFFN